MSFSPGKPKALSGAATKSYNVASAWEKTASLSSEQEALVELLSQACSQRPYPSHAHIQKRAHPGFPTYTRARGRAHAHTHIHRHTRACPLPTLFPQQVVEDQGYGAGPTEVHSRDAYSGTLEDAVLHNTNQVGFQKRPC
eukprot:1156421-Pelagomonas_calceolata.AAC.15